MVQIIPIDLAKGLDPDETDREVGELIQERSYGAEMILGVLPGMKFYGYLGEGKRVLSALIANLETPTWNLLMSDPSDWDMKVLSALSAFNANVITEALARKKGKIHPHAMQMLRIIVNL